MMAGNGKISLALVDDHTLFRKGLITLIEMAGDHYKVVFEADNGIQLMERLNPGSPPDIVMMDINMPGMDGFACVEWLRREFPDIKIVVLSMIEQEEAVIRMLKLGVRAYLCKDIEPAEFADALRSVVSKGMYYTDFITGRLVHSLQQDNHESDNRDKILSSITEREKQFLQLSCSDKTYNEIAAIMFLSPKTIDGYRDSLFEKLNVRSRVGLALFAVKHKLVDL